MRTTVLAILAAIILLAAPVVHAKGGGCSTPECEAQRKSQENLWAQEERAEQAKAAKAVAAGLEQVKEFRADDRNINSWLRANPAVEIVRVVSVGRDDKVLIFYHKRNR